MTLDHETTLMLMLVAGAVGGFGLVGVIYRRTLLGVMIGIQLLLLGAAMMFVLAGIASGAKTQGHVFGLFVAFSAAAQLVGGCALAIRLFYLREKAGMDQLRTLRR